MCSMEAVCLGFMRVWELYLWSLPTGGQVELFKSSAVASTVLTSVHTANVLTNSVKSDPYLSFHCPSMLFMYDISSLVTILEELRGCAERAEEDWMGSSALV